MESRHNKSPYFEKHIGKGNNDSANQGYHDVHGELLGHFNRLKIKRILIYANSFQSKYITQLTQPAVGRKIGLFWSQYDLIKDNLFKYKGHQGHDYDCQNGT